ncbi:MAG: MFS transporter [Eubacteriales bacterium]|nr:MFS transporter [Bacillota bacterium]MBV1727580.1 MFS transporter [Desulforudis sp.]MDP3051523.1 MFS transporter [Eubacteriales bacterium]MDQ7790276.1 MFS transporter [Clostridia bacterium]MBU4532825.1 MFS transporter [Bacillota bacterium]
MDIRIVLVLLASFTAFGNLYLAFIVVPAYLIEAGFSAVFAAAQNTVFAGAAVTLRFLFTPLVDRYRKWSLVLASAAFALAPLGLVWADSAATITAVRILQGFALALYPFSANAFIADVSPSEQRGSNLGLLRMVIILSLIVGPPFAVWAVGIYGYQTLFVALTLIGLVGLSPLLLLREPEHQHTRGNPLPLFKEVLKNRSIRPLLYATVLVGVAYGVILTFVPIYSLQLGVENYGVFFTVFAVSGILIGILAGRLSDHHGRARLAKPAVAAFGLGTVIVGLLAVDNMIWLSAVLAGMGYAASVTVLVAWLIDITQERLRATALSLYENSLDVGITVGVFVFGVIVLLIAYGWSFAIMGLTVFVLGVTFLNYSERRQAETD